MAKPATKKTVQIRVRVPGDVAAALAASQPAGKPVDLKAFLDSARAAKLMAQIRKEFI